MMNDLSRLVKVSYIIFILVAAFLFLYGCTLSDLSTPPSVQTPEAVPETGTGSKSKTDTGPIPEGDIVSITENDIGLQDSDNSDAEPSAAQPQDGSVDSTEEPSVTRPEGEASGAKALEGKTSDGKASDGKPDVVRYITGDGVRMRELPSTNAGIIKLLSYGDKVTLLEDEGRWSKVYYENAEGYIRNDLLSDTIPTERAITKPSVSAEAEQYKVSAALNSSKIVVKKSERKLELWNGDTLYGTYPIGLGWNPEGDKKVEGDGRTPEGEYYVCVRNPNSRFYLSLGVSYPNKEDAREALEAGIIDQNTYNKIANAIDRKSCPPWDTAMGGAIMIHGMGSSSDWTAGCVAVDNDVMDILWEHCPIGTPIIILP